jgi:hypothetical protein
MHRVGGLDMRSLRHLIAALVLAAAAPTSLNAESSSAPTAEALATASDLFAVTFDRAGVQLNAQAVDHTWPSLENALRTRNPMLDSTALTELRREFERIRLEKLRALLKDVPAIYARHLTTDEMREIAAFYRSPTGSRLMHVVPSVVGEILGTALPGMPGVINDTHEAFLQLARERGYIK